MVLRWAYTHAIMRIILVFMTLASVQVSAQLRQIDSSKLPSDERVRTAYSDAFSVEQYSRGWTNDWKYEIPKDKVISTLKASLHTLMSTQANAPQNEELLVLTGLVARLAYNVDIDEAYDIALKSFDSAHRLIPGDYRPEWFAGIHRCQASDIKAGMEQLLAVEDRIPWRQLPVDFWDDYITCSTVSLMPAHTMRAVSYVVQLGADRSGYNFAMEVAQKRYKITHADGTYPSSETWRAETHKDVVHFTNQVCGIGFSSRPDWHLSLGDVTNGACASNIEGDSYSGPSGNSTPNILVLAKVAQAGQALEDFVRLALGGRFVHATVTKASFCPTDGCLAYEVVDQDVYQDRGGEHLLVVAFANPAPEVPGLLFEKPDEPPKASAGGVHYYHPDERWSRLPGTLYSLVLLDSNGEIYKKAMGDFHYVLKSIQLD